MVAWVTVQSGLRAHPNSDPDFGGDGMRWRTVSLLLPALLLMACSGGANKCPPAPYFIPTVEGNKPGPNQLSGNGFYCGAIGDGVSSEALDPIQARPGDHVAIEYQSDARWDSLTFSVYRGKEAVSSGTLPRQGGSFQLPDQPATYAVSIEGHSKHGRTTTYFRVTVSR